MNNRKRKDKTGFSARASLMAFFAALLLLCGCGMGSAQESESGTSGETSGADFTAGKGTVLRILSGSENRELEQILTDCADKTGVKIEMQYKGSVDIMRELESGAKDYDAVWPASSIWISLGDSNHLVKHEESISMTPVVFGIKKSLSDELGFTGSEVSVNDILAAIRDGKMNFCMTSATQSNSGASAYIGFLYALLGKQEGMTVEDLADDALQEKITDLLSGVERSSGSSDWLKELFLKSDYDAMVNYECLIISANQELEKEGKELLQVIYPYDGLSIADSPLGYVDHGDSKKEEAFLAVQEYLLSEEAQQAIEATGRRITANGVSKANREIFSADWGIDTDRILSPIQMPDAEVLTEALNQYQTSFKKPSLNIYCLDYSGSMYGEGQKQLTAAMEQILVQSYARENLLQATDGEVNAVVCFSSEVLDVFTARDASDGALEELYQEIANYENSGGTDIYCAAVRALDIAAEYDIGSYTSAIILMTDGQSHHNLESFQETYEAYGMDIPVFSITFGDADPTQLDELAELTGGRVFDGTGDLTEAFRSVKGYN